MVEKDLDATAGLQKAVHRKTVDAKAPVEATAGAFGRGKGYPPPVPCELGGFAEAGLRRLGFGPRGRRYAGRLG